MGAQGKIALPITFALRYAQHPRHLECNLGMKQSVLTGPTDPKKLFAKGR